MKRLALLLLVACASSSAPPPPTAPCAPLAPPPPFAPSPPPPPHPVMSRLEAKEPTDVWIRMENHCHHAAVLGRSFQIDISSPLGCGNNKDTLIKYELAERSLTCAEGSSPVELEQKSASIAAGDVEIFADQPTCARAPKTKGAAAKGCLVKAITDALKKRSVEVADGPHILRFEELIRKGGISVWSHPKTPKSTCTEWKMEPAVVSNDPEHRELSVDLVQETKDKNVTRSSVVTYVYDRICRTYSRGTGERWKDKNGNGSGAGTMDSHEHQLVDTKTDKTRLAVEDPVFTTRAACQESAKSVREDSETIH